MGSAVSDAVGSAVSDAAGGAADDVVVSDEGVGGGADGTASSTADGAGGAAGGAADGAVGAVGGDTTGGQVLLVPTRVLLLVAACVWFAAGASVVSVGVSAATGAGWTLPMSAGFAAVFALFFFMFLRLAMRNTARILASPAPLSFLLSFFDANSYMVMAVMIFLGASVRLSTFVPDQVIAAFYCGLGVALCFAGFYPLISFIRSWTHPRFED